MSLKAVLKCVRASEPFNVLSTTLAKNLLSFLGRDSELAVKHLHRTGHVRTRLPNGRLLRLWSYGDDWVSNQVFWRGWDGFEPETARVFYQLARRAQVIIDIGAFTGYYSVVAASANSSARVFAFEPMPCNFQRLTKNIAFNYLKNVKCHQLAVSDYDGEAEFYHLTSNIPLSASLSRSFIAETGKPQSITVQTVRMDSFLQRVALPRVDLIKIDTESTEPEVLKGMAGCLRRDYPTLICEVLKERGAEQPLNDILSPLGYNFYLLTPNGPIQREKIVGHPIYLNYLFSTHSLNALTDLLEGPETTCRVVA